MKPVFLVGALFLWAGTSAAQNLSTRDDRSSTFQKQFPPPPVKTTHTGPYQAPPPVGRPDKPPKTLPVGPPVMTSKAARVTAKPRPSLSIDTIPLQSWATPYLQATVGNAEGRQWSGGFAGAFAGVDFVARGNMLFGFRAGVERFGAGAAPWLSDFWQTSLVVRFGAVVDERFLPYIVFGPAFAASAVETRLGVIMGLGVEYRFNQNWSATVEADYSHFGAAMNSFAWSPRELSRSGVKGGLIYHFPMSVPK